MKASSREWIDKAEADFVSAGREYRARKRPNFDAACFFAQQCIEKYLKARLVEAGIRFPKTHDLALPVEPLWDALRPTLNELTSYATAFRYPGESASRQIAGAAYGHVKRIRARIREDMGLRAA